MWKMRDFSIRVEVAESTPLEVLNFISAHLLDDDEAHGLMYAYITDSTVRQRVDKLLEATK